MQNFTYSFFSSVSTIEEVIGHMEALNENLQDTNLQNLIAFNKTYLIITSNVYKKLGKDYFKDDELMKKTDINFANYYFTALKNYITTKNCPPAWKILFDSCIQDNNFQFVYMAMGVNAHVNNDLPQTLTEVMDGSSFNRDFLAINTILRESIPEVVDSLAEINKKLIFIKKNLRPLYSFFLNFLIQNWRDHAWYNYQQLQKKATSIDRIEQEAKSIATTLSKITKMRNIGAILKTILFNTQTLG